jgi:hypothetical protein
VLPVVGIGSLCARLRADSIGAARFANVVCVVLLAGQLPPASTGAPLDDVEAPDEDTPDDPIPLDPPEGPTPLDPA